MEKFPWQLIPDWLNKNEALFWKEKLYENLSWEQPKVKLYGKYYLVPRKTIFLGGENVSYSYSGVTHRANGWPDWFKPLLNKVCEVSQNNYNGCLLNLYRDGKDRMGWHSDNEKELNPNNPISSLSLGSSRDFFLKHRHLNIKEVLCLSNGDLLVMKPACQKYWIHSVPIRKKINSYRINLTFRSYIT